MRRDGSGGFSMLETLVSLTIVSLTLGGLATLMIHNSRLNRNEQMTSKAQADARNCMSLIVNRLRTAGWNPHDLPFDPVTVDTDLVDGVSWIEIRADLNSDGDLADDFEQTVIRHMGNLVEWRGSPDSAFEALADGITNDADGDGVVEPMIETYGIPTQWVKLRITAESPDPSPLSGEPVRYTVESEVLLRSRLLPLR